MIILAKLLINLIVSETKLKYCDHKFNSNFMLHLAMLPMKTAHKRIYEIEFFW